VTTKMSWFIRNWWKQQCFINACFTNKSSFCPFI